MAIKSLFIIYVRFSYVLYVREGPGSSADEYVFIREEICGIRDLVCNFCRMCVGKLEETCLCFVF